MKRKSARYEMTTYQNPGQPVELYLHASEYDADQHYSNMRFGCVGMVAGTRIGRGTATLDTAVDVHRERGQVVVKSWSAAFGRFVEIASIAAK